MDVQIKETFHITSYTCPLQRLHIVAAHAALKAPSIVVCWITRHVKTLIDFGDHPMWLCLSEVCIHVQLFDELYIPERMDVGHTAPGLPGVVEV